MPETCNKKDVKNSFYSCNRNRRGSLTRDVDDDDSAGHWTSAFYCGCPLVKYHEEQEPMIRSIMIHS